jgi:hypothetical protein
MGYVEISETEVAEALWNGLVRMGYAPNSDELFDLAMIIFSFLIDKGVLVEELDDDL